MVVHLLFSGYSCTPAGLSKILQAARSPWQPTVRNSASTGATEQLSGKSPVAVAILSHPSFSAHSSQLPLEQVGNHLAARDARRLPQRLHVEGARQAVGEAEEEHGRDPAAGVLEREAALGHLVLLHHAAAQVVHAALRVHLRLVLARHVGHLRARQDVEVVVGRVPARVALCADGGACGIVLVTGSGFSYDAHSAVSACWVWLTENDEILCDTCDS